MAKPINKQHAKTIHRILTGFVGVNNETVAAGNSYDISTGLDTALLTAGWHNNAVPNQVQADLDSDGVRITANTRLEVISSATLSPISDDEGREIFAVLSEAAGVYTLDFKVFDGANDIAVSVPAGDYNFVIPYAFKFEDFPIDAMISSSTSAVGDDPINVGGRQITELITVTATNTLADLTFTAIPGTLSLHVAGHMVSEVQTALSVAGKALTWTSDADSYDIETTDVVVAMYHTLA